MDPFHKIPGIGGKKSEQIRKAQNKSADDTKEEEYQPIKPVIIDLETNFQRAYSQEENYRAYKLFNIIDSNNGGTITLRELKRCLMGDTFRTFKVHFDHPDSGFVFGLDEDVCVMVDKIEQDSPAANDPYLIRGLQVWKVNDTFIPPNDPKSLALVYKILLQCHDEPVDFEIVEPILQITTLSNIIDIEALGQIFSVALPVGAVYNLAVFEKKMKKSLIKTDKVLKAIKVSFDGKRRQTYFRCDEFEFALIFQSGPNFQRSARYALGFSTDDSPTAFQHKGQPMVFDLDLGVKPIEAETVLSEIFTIFDADGSGEFEYEEFRDFYIKFLDTDESIDLLRRYAQYRFRDLQKEAKYYEQIRLREFKRERRKLLVEKERPLRKIQRDFYFANSEFDNFGIRRRAYRGYRPANKIIIRTKPRKYRIKRVKPSDGESEIEVDVAAKSNNNDADNDGDDKDDNGEEDEENQTVGGQSQDSDQDSSIGDESAAMFVKLTPAEKLMKRVKMKALRLKHATERRLKLNEIFAQNATINRQNRKDALQTKGTLTAVHMQEVHHALKLARKTAVRTEESGVRGITQMNVSFTHVIATPALIISATMFTDQADNDDIELENLPSSKMHPAVQRYFLIRESKRVNAEFDSYIKHPAFFTADYEREPSRHSSYAMGICKIIERQQQPGIDYRKQYRIEPEWKHVPAWDSKREKAGKVGWKRPEKALKSDRLVARATVRSIAVADLPAMNPFIINSPFVSIVCGEYRYSSEANSLSGTASQWDDLNWVVRIRAKDTFFISVYTGTVRSNTLIGKTTVSALDLVDKPVDKAANLELMFQLYTEAGKPSGNVKFTFFMEQGSEWDWFRADYIRKQNQLAREKKLNKWLLRRANAPKSILPFPLKFIVLGIKAFDLQSVHLILQNSPYVTLEYGDAEMKQSDVKEGAGYTAEWVDLGWEARCSTRRNNMIFTVHSGYSVIGRFSISGADLNKLPRTKAGYVEILGPLTAMPPAQPIQTGRITVSCKMDISNAIFVAAGQHTLEDLATIADTTVDYSTVTYITDYTPIPPRGILPVRAKLLYIAVAGIPPIRGGKPYSPCVLVQCGRWFQSTEVLKEKGGNAEWQDLDWFFPINDRMDFTFKVINSSSKTETKQMGMFTCTARDFVDYPRNKVNNLEQIENLTDGATIIGKIKFIVHFDHEGDEGFVTDMIDKALKIEQEEQEALKRKTKDAAFQISGYGDGVAMPGVETSDGYKLNETKPFMYAFLPESKFGSHPDRIPFRMTITSALAIDMRPVHVFASNSPHLNASCGSWAAITQTIVNAGVAATWGALSWAFFVYEKKNVRIAVWSEEKLIGTATFSPEDLLYNTVDKVGKSTITAPIMNGAVSGGQVRINYFLESMFDEIQLDAHRFLPEVIAIEPPIRMTLFTVSCNGLRSVHLFTRNSPLVKVACGRYFASTKPITNAGKNAKWEEVGWSIYITDETFLKITVQSDSVVIGFIILQARELVAMPIDKYGLTEIEAYLNDGRTQGDSGRIRIVCRLESHFEEEEVPSDDEEEVVEMKDNQIWKTFPDGTTSCIQIPRITHAEVLGISVLDLKSVHVFTSNSPFCIMETGQFISATSVQPFKGNKASWLDLGWSYFLTASSSIKISVNSGTKIIGQVSFTTRDLYVIEKDDLDRTLLVQTILYEGVPMGTLKVQYKITVAKDKEQYKLADELKEDVDFKRFNFDDNGAKAVVDLKVPVLVKVVRASVIDLAQIHGGFLTNSPYIQMTCGGFSRETNSKLRGGANALWEDMDWAFVIMDEHSVLQVSVMSGWSRAGTLSMKVESLLRLPRGKNGEVEIQGNMMKSYGDGRSVSKGKVLLNMIISPYVSEEEQKRLDELALEELREKTRLPRILAIMEIQTVTVSNLIQVYGLFKNSPKVDLQLGDWRATTGVAFNTGSFATWTNLGWSNIPIRDKQLFSIEVSSGNEHLGSLKMTSVQLINIIPTSVPDIEGEFKAVEVKGLLVDGGFAKGRISLLCKIDLEGIAAIRDLQVLMQSNSMATSITSGTGRLFGAAKDTSVAKTSWPDKDVSLLESSVSSWVSEGRSQEPLEPLEMMQQSIVSSNDSLGKPDQEGSMHIGEEGFNDDIDVGHPSLQSITSLSVSTPTPVATRVVIMSISVQDLKKVKSYSQNNPEVLLECGTFNTKTNPIKRGGAKCGWEDLNWVFVMKRMTFMKITVSTDTLPVGVVSVSTRELLGVAPDASGDVIITRNLQLSGETTGKIKLSIKVNVRHSVGMASTEQQMKLAGEKVSINRRLLPPPQLPMTVRIIRIAIIDIIQLHTIMPNSPFVQITCGLWKKRTKTALAAGSNTQWVDLRWTLDVFDASATIDISVISGSSKAGSRAVKVGELLGIPRSHQGYTEVSGTLWTDKELIAGQVNVTMLLSPFVSEEEQQVLLKRADAEAKDEGRTPRLLAYLSINTVTCIELSEVYPTLDLSASMGKWTGKKTSESTVNKVGMLAWGDMENWENIAMYEKVALLIEIMADDKVVGIFSMSSQAIMAQPADEKGDILLFGDVLDGDIVVGKMSVGGSIQHKIRPKRMRKGLEVIDDEATIASAFKPSEFVKEPFWSEQVKIEGIFCDKLKSVHTLGKNSPQIKLECGTWKDQTLALPYAGKSAEWKDPIKWENPTLGVFRMKQKGPQSVLKIIVQSSSVIIGTVSVKCEDILTAERTKKGKLSFTAEISKYASPAGQITIQFRFLPEPEPAPAPPTYAPPKIFSASNSLMSVQSAGGGRGLHIIEEDKDDYSELLDPTFVGDLNASASQVSKSPIRPDLPQLQFPLGFEYSYSGTSLSHVSQGPVDAPICGSLVFQDNPGSGRPRTSRGSESGKDTQRSALSHPSWPSSTDRSEATSYYTDRSESDGGSLYSSRYSSARSDFYSSEASSARSGHSFSTGRSEESQDSTRADSYYYDGYSESGRSSNHTQSSRSNYSHSSRSESEYSDYSTATSQSRGSSGSSYASSRSSLQSSKTGKSSATSDSSQSEDEGEDEGGEGDVPSGMFVASSSGTSPVAPLQSTRVDITAEFDLTPLRWWSNDSTKEQVALYLAREVVRGMVGQTVQGLAAECTGQSFMTTISNSGLGSYEFPIADVGMSSHALITDVAITFIKRVFAMAGASIIQKASKVAFTAADYIASARATSGPPASPPVGIPTGPQFKKRQALIFTDGLYKDAAIKFTQEEVVHEDEKHTIDYNDKVFGKVRGLFTVPILKASFTILDVMGFDISFMDRRVLPVRPYMTACKPFSDWAAETGPVWFNNRGLQSEDMKIGYRDLSGQWGWTPVILRIGQNLVFDWHDSSSGLIFAKLTLQYEDMECVPCDENEVITFYVEAQIANEYGGGITAGVIRMMVDLDCNYWKRPLKPPEYWQEHRIHHWKTFPVPTISAGQVRSNYREISRGYDKQMYVHPALFGFRMRWRCDPHKFDESKFINPIFQGFTLAKKPPTKRMEEDARKKMSMMSSPNPWHWDVTAHLRGKCPVCGDGEPGCPRCWMIPTRSNGDRLSPEDFQFDPEMETKRAADELSRKNEREAQRQARKKNLQRLIDAGRLDPNDVDSDDETDSVLRREQMHADDDGLKVIEIHTKMTTFKALRLYRAVCVDYITIYIKVLPGSYIRKLIARPEDSIFHVWNMFCSHADIGLSDSKMFVLPTSVGFFEMHGENEGADENNLADNRGRDTMARYGFKQRGSVATIIYLPKYFPKYTVSLLQSFFMRNTSYQFNKGIKTFDQVDELLPPALHEDDIQRQLSNICSHLYELQQKEYKASYEELGYLFRIGSKADIEARIKLKREQRLKEEAEKAHERRLESQLKGLSPEERAIKLKELTEREAHKKGHVSIEEELLMREKQAAYKEKMEKLQKRRDEFRIALNNRGKKMAATKIGGVVATMNTNDKKAAPTSVDNQAKDDSSEDEDRTESAKDLLHTEEGPSLNSDDSEYLYDEYSDSDDYSDSDEDEDDDDEYYSDDDDDDEEEGEEEEKEQVGKGMVNDGEGGDLISVASFNFIRSDEGSIGKEAAEEAAVAVDSARSKGSGSSRGRKQLDAAIEAGKEDGTQSARSDASSLPTETTYSSRLGWSMADDWRSNPPSFRTDVTGTSSTSSSRSGTETSRSSRSSRSSASSYSNSTRSEVTSQYSSSSSRRDSDFSETSGSSFYTDSRRSSEASVDSKYSSSSASDSRRSSDASSYLSSVPDSARSSRSGGSSSSSASYDLSRRGSDASTATFSSSQSQASDDYTHRYHSDASSSSYSDSRRSSRTMTDFDSPRSYSESSAGSYDGESYATTSDTSRSYSSSGSYTARSSRDNWDAAPSRPASADSAARNRILGALGVSQSQQAEEELFLEMEMKEEKESKVLISPAATTAGSLAARLAAQGGKRLLPQLR